ncbi:hypothetical protein PPYR_01022 [Photinus pyralis]|uniref:BESS domain-containing protein n=1 Tax=Photinus pyralis TaxID=7054 RepID=A0A1Y1KWT3_PHOPY|nr:hypothetical protein PPYR_01022 [Photinus pyralis]
MINHTLEDHTNRFTKKMADEIIEQDLKNNTELIRLLQSDRQSESNPSCFSNCKIENCQWTSEETNYLLQLLSNDDLFPQLKIENDETYLTLSKLMRISGFTKSQLEIKSFCLKLKEKYKSAQLSDELMLKLSPLLCEETEMIFIEDRDYKSSNYQNCNSTKRNIWSHQETDCIIEVLEKYGMPNRTNLRKFCSVAVEYLKEHGFLRSEEQTQVKIKRLKALYNQVIRKTLKAEEFPFFDRIKSVMYTQEGGTKTETEDCFVTDEQTKCDDNANTEYDILSTRKVRQIWTNKETRTLLKFIEDNNIVTGKQLRRIMSKAVKYLANYGFCRSPTQILVRWKNTKALYWSTLRKQLPHPDRECAFFYQLHNILNKDDCSYTTMLDSADEENATCSGEENFSSKGDSSAERIVIASVNANSQHIVKNLTKPVSQQFHIQVNEVDFALDNEDRTAMPSPKRTCTEKIQSTFSGCATCGHLDPVDHYCVSLAHSIKQLDSRKQAKLKIEIQKLMYKAEFDPDF